MCYIVLMDEHLKGLNKEQKEAALHVAGPLLIVAGAGAGKTKTITHRNFGSDFHQQGGQGNA